MLPVVPHLANECLEKLKFSKDVNWPEVDKKYLNEEFNEIVIQVNGKKRGLINVKKQIDEAKIINQINEWIQWLEDTKLKIMKMRDIDPEEIKENKNEVIKYKEEQLKGNDI